MNEKTATSPSNRSLIAVLQGFGPSLGEKAGRVAFALIFPLALLLLWQLSATFGWLPRQILPSPYKVIEAFNELVEDGSLREHITASLVRVVIGFAIGALAGTVLGAVFGLFLTVRAYVRPVILAIAQVNALAWLPLLVLFLGIDEPLKYVAIGWSAGIPVLLGLSRGIENVSPAWRELGRVLQFDKRDTLTLIVLPGALPSYFTGLREGLANAWQALVIAELFASFEGLGYLMTWGRQLFQLEIVLVAMVLVGFFGLVLNLILEQLERLAQPWLWEA